jgi:hypothetical protein
MTLGTLGLLALSFATPLQHLLSGLITITFTFTITIIQAAPSTAEAPTVEAPPIC